MTQLTTTTPTYYLECLACRVRFESVYRNAKCPDCSALSRVRGVKVDESPADQPDDEDDEI